MEIKVNESMCYNYNLSSRPIRRVSCVGKKGLYSYSLDPLDSGLKLNSDISKESSSVSVLKPVPSLSDGPAWVEENQQNKAAHWRAHRIESTGLGL